MHFPKNSKPFLEENRLINIRSKEEKAVNFLMKTKKNSAKIKSMEQHKCLK